MSKFRGVSCVIHNVFESDRMYWYDNIKLLNHKEFVLSLEPYVKEKEGRVPLGHHLHVYMSFTNPRSKFEVLRELQTLGEGHVDYQDPIQGAKGRVQVDKMRGTFAQATAYLTKDLTKKKHKICGEPMKHVAPVPTYPCGICHLKYHNSYFLHDSMCYVCEYSTSMWNSKYKTIYLLPEDKKKAEKLIEEKFARIDEMFQAALGIKE